MAPAPSPARLVEAVRAGDAATARALLEARPELADMEMSESDERGALHYAVLARQPEMVRLLMRHGADARRGVYPHRAATTPLALASQHGYSEIVAVIEEEERRLRPDPATPAHDDLSRAVLEGQPAVIEEEERRRRPEPSVTPAHDDLSRAVPEGQPAVIHASRRADWTPLHLAAAALDADRVAWLLERGADVDCPGPDGRSPLDLADGTGWRHADGLQRYPAVAAILRQRGAALTPRSAVALGEAAWLRARHAEGSLANPIEGPGGLLSVAVRHNRPDMLALLLDLGFDPDERTRLPNLDEAVYSWGMPLHHCAGLGRQAMAAMLLERGADPNGQVYASGSVMYSALAAGDNAMAGMLERYGGFADAATVGHLRLTARAARMLEDHDAGRLPKGAFSNQSLEWELLWAGLRGGDPEIVRMALERLHWPRDDPRWFGMLASPLPGHSPRSPEDQALYLACFRLVLARCDPNVRHPGFGRTVLHDVAASDEAVSPEEAQAFAACLLDAGARLDPLDDLLRCTPLAWARRWGRTELVNLFLERGAGPAEPDAECGATGRPESR